MAGAMSALPEIPAATLVVFRNGPAGGPPQLLMVVRSRAMSFAGGMAVFPGGRVDPADRALAETLGVPDADEGAHRIAAIRETIEETGLAPGLAQRLSAGEAAELRSAMAESSDFGAALEARGLTLNLDALTPFARWCPRGVTSHRIFDTRFYLADLGTGAVDLAVDATENTRLFWTTAADALAAADRGELSIIFPTRRNLERLALFASFAEAKAQADAIPVRLIVPRAATRDGREVLTIPEDAGYPITAEPLDRAMRG
nr:NUDIX domain-containing protein [Qipengyuania sediminis]